MGVTGGSGTGTKLEFTKPASTPTGTPTGSIAERTPTTSYDVDIYEPKAGDTYESICREFYNDTRYAAALRAYNGNKPLQGIRSVDVPPIHVLRRVAQGQLTPGTPAGRTGIGTVPEWGPSTVPAPTTRPGGGTTFRVPPGGMTLRAIAREVLNSEQRWTEIFDLNRQITKPDEPLPAGTEVKLPPDARPPG